MSVVATSQLAHLAATANHETQLALGAGTAMIQHAINAGEALLEAKTQVPRGAWLDWLGENFERSMVVAQQCMRVARHKQVVIEGQATSFKGALMLLHGGQDSRVDPALQAEARRLRSEGLTYKRIAETLGITKSRDWVWCNPEAEKRRLEKERRHTIAGRRALNRQKRDATARRAGGGIAEAYALVRKALKACEHATEEASGVETKRAISDATNRLFAAEDALVKAGKESFAAGHQEGLRAVA